jgi:hypothetical protein
MCRLGESGALKSDEVRIHRTRRLSTTGTQQPLAEIHFQKEKTVKGRRLSLIVAGAILLTAMLCAPVAADTTVQSDFAGVGGLLGNFHLVSSATWANDIWTYSYTLTYLGTSGVAAHEFTLDNRPHSQFDGATNLITRPDTTTFTWDNPDFSVAPSLLWNGNLRDMMPGDVGVFSYTSAYGPATGRMLVYAHVADGGDSASGLSVGMGNVLIPEPGAFAGLFLGLGAMVPFLKRRRQ